MKTHISTLLLFLLLPALTLAQQRSPGRGSSGSATVDTTAITTRAYVDPKLAAKVNTATYTTNRTSDQATVATNTAAIATHTTQIASVSAAAATGQNIVGYLYKKNYFVDLNDFVQVGTSPASAGSGVITLAANTDFSRSIRVRQFATTLPQWEARVVHKMLTTNTSNNYGCVLQISSINTTSVVSIEAYLNTLSTSADYGKLIIHDIFSNTYTKTTSTTLLQGVNDVVELVLTKNETVYTLTANNITQGTSLSLSATNSLTFGGVQVSHNTSQFGVQNAGGGTYSISEMSFRSFQQTGIDRAGVGDSITAGSYAGSSASRWAKLINADVFAGGGDKTLEVLQRIEELRIVRPKRVYLMIGTNDLLQSVSSGTWQANYRAIVSQLEGAGIVVIKIAPPPSNATSMAGILSFLSSTYPTTYIDCYTPLLGSGTTLNATYDAGDGTHINSVGNTLINTTIRASALYQ